MTNEKEKPKLPKKMAVNQQETPLASEQWGITRQVPQGPCTKGEENLGYFKAW